MKNNKKWLQLIGLKIISVCLHTITLGIPKALKWIDNKISEITNELKN